MTIVHKSKMYHNYFCRKLPPQYLFFKQEDSTRVFLLFLLFSQLQMHSES